ncbi:Diacylglycerol kinase [Streptomyces sp. RB5]|uniref:Diacylglycerol kinase n=1 Tax=Streptomyces smaragdinus TaxID=2585196 RepID=A0A7K0CAM1_9ACTN|nr:YegS/Rv2252/BmrU family lipid kinase [Streptomyces smaragdinus]MQY10489.1 Diacylglycerol kinase [Streptomyces smaragdinus]
MRQYTAVINPAAGGSAGAAVLHPLARLLREAGAEVEVSYSRSLDHAAELALEAGQAGRTVLAVGGDGMTGRIGGALAGTDTVCGIVPAGRGNDFARALGLPTEPGPLAELLLNGEPRAVDAIRLTSAVHKDTAVLGSVYSGVDAVANQNANNSRLLRGSASYYMGALRAVAGWRPAGYRLTVDGTEYERRGYTVVVANSGYYGFGRQIAPAAKVDDGVLDVVVLHHVPRRMFFAVMNELKDGSHVKRPEVEVLTGTEVRIEADRELPYGADGEIDASLPVTARVLPGALRVLA